MPWKMESISLTVGIDKLKHNTTKLLLSGLRICTSFWCRAGSLLNRLRRWWLLVLPHLKLLLWVLLIHLLVLHWVHLHLLWLHRLSMRVILRLLRWKLLSGRLRLLHLLRWCRRTRLTAQRPPRRRVVARRCELVYVTLEFLELLSSRLTGCYDTHKFLEFYVCSSFHG